MASSISVVNIGVGFLVGWFSIPYKNHISRYYSVMSVLFTIFILAILCLFNLMIAHFREALAIDPDSANILAFESFRGGILSISDIQSWLLFFMGIIFSILAMYKGYHFDDEYPGYGKLAKRRDKIRERIVDLREEVFSGLDSISEEFNEALEERFEEVCRKDKQLNNFISAFCYQNKILRAYISHLESAYDYIVRLYRDTNSAERMDGVPMYFKESVDKNLNIETIDTTYIDSRDVLAESREELARILPDVRAQMLAARNDYQSKVEGVCKI